MTTNELMKLDPQSASIVDIVSLLNEQYTFTHEHAIELKILKDQVKNILEREPVNPIFSALLTKLRKEKVMEIIGGKTSPAYRDQKLAQETFRSIAKEFKEHFKIPRYDLLQRQFQDDAVEFIKNWTPSITLSRRIRKANKV